MDSDKSHLHTELRAAYTNLNTHLEDWVKVSWGQQQAVTAGNSEDLVRLVALRESMMLSVVDAMRRVQSITGQCDSESWGDVISSEQARASRLHAEAARVDAECARLISAKMSALARQAQGAKVQQRCHTAYQRRTPVLASRFLDQDR